MKNFVSSISCHVKSLLVCTGLVALSSSSLEAAPGDSHWDRQFGLPGVNNRVYALRFNGDQLYASGYAVGAGGQIATNTSVDIFDGTNWSSAIGELTGGVCVIYDVGFLGNDIYVGGVFSKADGVTAPGLAKWNGSEWSNVGFAGVALSLVSDGTNLYVGGAFTNAGGVISTNVARYDGTNWHTLGSSLGYYANSISPAVNVLKWHNGLLYAGGSFTNSGSLAVSNIAVWDGVSWSGLGSGVNNGVTSLALQGDDLFVGGSFTAAGGVSAFGIAKWNGASWSALGTGCKGGVYSIGVLGSDIYVGGSFTNVGGVNARSFAKWDGFSWTTWPITDGVFQYPLNDAANNMVAKDGSLYIGGVFNQAGGVHANHVVRYDGSNFYPLGEKPANGFATPAINVACIGQADDGIYVGGLFTAAGKTAATRIARWDGTNWFEVGGGTAGGTGTANRVLAIAGRGSDVFVGGAFTNVGGINVSNVARWDGASWHNLGYGFDANVSVLVATPTDVYAGGSFTLAYDPPFTVGANRIARWDGLNWWNLGTGLGGTVNAIAVSGSDVYAGGSFTTAGGNPANRIAKWNGSSWSALGSGASGTVLTIAINGSDVYIGGSFAAAGGVNVGGIAKWNGTTWSGLGSGVTNSPDVRALAFGNDGKLYCAGQFTNISGVSAVGVARWDGTKWEPLGSGVFGDSAGSRASRCIIRGEDIYFIGTFTGAGLSDSSGIARWNETIDFTPPFILGFSRTQLLPGNIFKSRINCSERVTYLLEYSENLQTWTPLMTNSAKQLDFTNAAAFPARVFRTRGIP